MKTIIFNDDNLRENEIEDTVLKARAIIINDNNEVLLSKCAGFYLFPGGKLHKNESAEEGLMREIREETGIVLHNTLSEPFLRIKHMIKHYPKRGQNNIFGSRQNITDYYLIKTNKDIDISQIRLTQHEKNAEFQTIRTKFRKIPELINNIGDDIRSKCFSKEINTVISEFKKYF